MPSTTAAATVATAPSAARSASPAPKATVAPIGRGPVAEVAATNGTAASGRVQKEQQMATLAAVLFWFLFNISLSTLTKWTYLYGEVCIVGKGCTQYTFPLTLTAVHMLFSWTICRLYIAIDGRPRGKWLTMSEQIRKVVPLAACFAASVAMGNLSLKYIYPSFNQMLGSMSPLITVLMSVAFLNKRYSSWTWASMPVLCGGLALCSAHEVHFHLIGGLFATGATVLRGAKSIMQGKLLDPGEKIDSVTLLCYMAPWAALFLLIGAGCNEGLEPVTLLWPAEGKTGVGRIWALLVAGGLIACMLNIMNFLVTLYTSAVTLQVLGNVKSCLSIAVSVAVFRNPLLFSQGVGVAVCLLGVGMYNKWSSPVKRPSQQDSSSKHD